MLGIVNIHYDSHFLYEVSGGLQNLMMMMPPTPLQTADKCWSEL